MKGALRACAHHISLCLLAKDANIPVTTCCMYGSTLTQKLPPP